MSFSVAAIGECMIELSGDGEGIWKSSYAGDTFNTLWTMRALLPQNAKLDYVTAFGDDPFSQKQQAFFAANGVGVAKSPTIIGERPGLYAITLDGFERSFTYWRNDAAARHLADDALALRQSLENRDLIYLSGITLAILTPSARETLMDELSQARARGSTIAFDPNYRSRLWPTDSDAQRAINDVTAISQIVLPTFQDERDLFGDCDPDKTIARVMSAGVRETIVKCGANPAQIAAPDLRDAIPAEAVANPVDTTGAGDAFNGGYLTARLMGRSISDACISAHQTAAASIQYKGALTPKVALMLAAQSKSSI